MCVRRETLARRGYADRMCGSYGIRAVEEIGARLTGSRVRFSASAAGGAEGAGRAGDALTAWSAAHRGRARITGRLARNLNPVIHAPGGERELSLGWWWLHVAGRPAEYSAFNSRDDKLLRSWREPFQRRALLPADWYLEQKRLFGLPDQGPFAIAAITAPVAPDEDGTLVSYSMVTRDAVGAPRRTHPRMPLILPADMHEEWLDPRRVGDAGLVARALAASEELSHAVLPLDGDAAAGILGPDRTQDPPEPAQPTLF